MTDQGANFISELVKNFEKLFQIRHIKTTAFHSESNGGLERAHSVVGDLIRTCVHKNNIEWDKTLKIITMGYNTAVHEGTGYTPFELTFGRSANLPSALATTSPLKFNELIQIWSDRHEKYIAKARATILKNKEKHKRIYDGRIAKVQTIFRVGDTVLLYNNNKKHQNDQEWLGPYLIHSLKNDHNYYLLVNNELYLTHGNILKLYHN